MQKDRVSGPYSQDQVEAQYSGGQIDADCLIWGRSLTQWQSLTSWRNESARLLKTDKKKDSSKKEEAPHQMWHYAVDGQSKGPITRVELINELKSLQLKGEILVWTKGMKAWVDIYQFHDLLDEAGLNRREHPRASLSGSVIVHREGQPDLIGILKTISTGGFGATQLDKNLAIGQIVSVEIKSESLSSYVMAKAVVQYVSESGFFGFQFQGLHQEAKSSILEYIRAEKNATAA